MLRIVFTSIDMHDGALTSVAESPRVSVVMPVFNGEVYLASAVESVLRQTLEELELVVVDDCSRDGSLEIVKRLARRDPRITLVANETNLGIAGARNRGWQRARGTYIAVLDQDDVALPDRLCRQAGFLDAHPSVAAVGGTTITIDSGGRRISTRRYPTKNRVIRSTLLRHNCFGHSAVMMRRAALEAVGGYRFNSGIEDYDLWLRLSDRFELANIAEPIVLHRLHLKQQTGAVLERQTREALAVRSAARTRRAYGRDPLAGLQELTPEVLGRLKIDEVDARSAVARELIARAAIIADLGYPAEAESLVEHACQTAGNRAAMAVAATMELKRAESLLRAGRRLAAVGHVLAAFKREPGHTFSLLRGWLAPRVPFGVLGRWA